MRGPEDNTPLVGYVEKSLWANPEENQQYQVELVRVTDNFGVNRNFSYMNKWRSVPKANRFYHIYSVGGLNAGYWNFKTQVIGRNPLDRWINLSSMSRYRGLQLDLYTATGLQFSRAHAWMMTTYDGLTLIAFEKLKPFPLPSNLAMYFRCYSPSQEIDKGPASENNNNNPFIYESMVYENQDELATLTSRYQYLKGKPGFTGTFHNGIYFHAAPNAVQNLRLGDVVEIWHDPTVIRTEIYNYNNLADFYSELDNKRKVILHPPKRKGDFTIRYFDDNDYYLVGPSNKGLYLNRNHKSTVRQLTHVDVSVADDAIQNTCSYLRDLNNVSAVRILVLVRKTDWEFEWPNEHQRIRYLYRFNDADIVKAFTGARANMPEWTANGLESGPVVSLLRGQYNTITRDAAIMSMGYNAATRALSETPIRATYELGGRGVEVPVTYRASFTAWEHDEAGHLLGYYHRTDSQYYAPVNPTCAKVEFTLGGFGRTLDYVITNVDTPVDPNYDLRVFKVMYNIATGEPVGEWTDVTDDDSVYIIQDGVLQWTGLDRVNYRGVLLFNTRCLAYTFELDHIDHSLAFALTQVYEDGGSIVSLSFGQLDIWLNGHPLVDNVDWIFKDQYCYIHNKEFLVEGPQKITVRAHSFHPETLDPNSHREIGFVDGGVIGRFARYNLRGDRVTRTVINGALYLSDEVPRAEREVPDDQWSVLNGKPYMVKHVYCPIKQVVDYKNFPFFERSREVDQRVSDYMTRYLPKPQTPEEEILWEGEASPGSGLPVPPNLLDKYRLFSPFMNVIVNGLKNGLITLPAMTGGDAAYSWQDIEDRVAPYKWWLAHDPITLDYDRRYFAIMPYANVEKLTVTANELIFIKQVNDRYLQSVCVVEGHFNVNL